MCTHLLFSRVLLRFNKEGRFNEAKDEHEPNKNEKKEVKDEHGLDSFPFDASIPFVFVVSTLIYFSRMLINVGESRLILF